MNDIGEVLVVGAGVMGGGIAQVAAMNGARVTLVEPSAETLGAAMKMLRQRFERAVEKGALSEGAARRAAEGLRSLAAIPERCDARLAIEAVVERLDVKHKVFRQLEAACPADCILATNTSSLSVAAIAGGIVSAERVVGMHFFNPAPLMPLVEIIAHPKIDAHVVVSAFTLAKQWGKEPVHVKDSPGFIVNRVARGFYLEAMRLLGEGAAEIERIDRVMRDAGGFRMGPFELMDLVGLDVNYAVSRSVWEQMGRPPRLEPHAIQKALVEQGRLGRKTGAGFYDHSSVPPRIRVQPPPQSAPPPIAAGGEIAAFCTKALDQELSDPVDRLVFARILGAIINEAGLALDDGIAEAGDIDLAMKKGTNYPHGPVEWGQRIGSATVKAFLEAIERHDGKGRFVPARHWRDAQ